MNGQPTGEAVFVYPGVVIPPMTTEHKSSNETAVVRGRPFQPGQSGNPNGRPRKKLALRDLLTNVPQQQKRELVAVAYELALDGDVHWAEWIAKHSGEGQQPGEHGDHPMRELIIREYAEWPSQLQ